MGYYSEVALVLNHTATTKLSEEIGKLPSDLQGKVISFLLEADTRKQDSLFGEFYHWEHIKWYESDYFFPEVNFMASFIRKISKHSHEITDKDEAQILFCRIGSQLEDLEVIGSLYENPFTNGIQRSIDMINIEDTSETTTDEIDDLAAEEELKISEQSEGIVYHLGGKLQEFVAFPNLHPSVHTEILLQLSTLNTIVYLGDNEPNRITIRHDPTQVKTDGDPITESIFEYKIFLKDIHVGTSTWTVVTNSKQPRYLKVENVFTHPGFTQKYNVRMNMEDGDSIRDTLYWLTTSGVNIWVMLFMLDNLRVNNITVSDFFATYLDTYNNWAIIKNNLDTKFDLNEVLHLAYAQR